MLASDPALQTFAALFLGHVAADYLFQTGWMVANKGRLSGLSAHIAVVFAMTLIAVGGGGVVPVLLLTAIHATMDLTKARLLPQGPLWPYMLDQTVHVVTAASIAVTFPNIFAQGIWPTVFGGGTDAVMQAALIVAGAVFAIEAGNHAIAILLKPVPRGADLDSHSVATLAVGRRIGQLERGLAYLLMLVGQPLGILILVAAKVALRAKPIAQERISGEYVILGTLASLGWAIATGLAIRLLLDPVTLESLAILP